MASEKRRCFEVLRQSAAPTPLWAVPGDANFSGTPGGKPTPFQSGSQSARLQAVRNFRILNKDISGPLTNGSGANRPGERSQRFASNRRHLTEDDSASKNVYINRSAHRHSSPSDGEAGATSSHQFRSGPRLRFLHHLRFNLWFGLCFHLRFGLCLPLGFGLGCRRRFGL
jgi:hypothetical protein